MPISKQKILAVLYSGGEYAKREPKMLGTIERKLGIENWLKENGHELVVTDDKEGPDSEFAKHIVDADILITTPFHPAYLTREMISKAKNLKLCITAGVGSDHIDLNAANERKITVTEVSGSNVVSVAEHVVMMILSLVRNYMPAHEQVSSGGWNVAQVASNAYDLESKVVGTLGAGRIGYRVLQRLAPFDCAELLYYDYQPLKPELEKKVNARRVTDLKEFLGQLDVLTINCPLHEETRGILNKESLSWMKKGAWIVNTARGALAVKEDVAAALESGHIAGYAGDVWEIQPAPVDHPWRKMKSPHGTGNGMTAHYSGTTLDAQARYAEGTRKILEDHFEGKDQEPQNVIVIGGQYASKAYGQRNGFK
ncbi:uncharacterized protein MELLADRAFT_105917 [Melampsora larici-populina 98AG31]|uniref:Formate dehydrogenase n=1 Tax=Melampsora larici-populina (strain 98AG31 / pathotype 3-4-7) TaxID=747676 RepID=F4RJR7_MELLP|nr:uncharacterized protein MELLADRAFT_105917 [Melampsora larici-populina 98AG31]EGG07359.1 hypothetical protein MELLADRAFT_105917 [Melampsora larici-populina 98AG31]